MRNSLADVRWVAVLLLAVAFPRPAQADPIVITSGFVVVPSLGSGFDFARATFTGENSIFSGILFADDVAVPSQGGLVNLSHSVGLTDDFPVHHPALEVVNGISYEVFLSAGLDFTAEPFVVPPAPADQSSFAFSTPMTMTGHITGFGASPSPSAPVLFSADVTGSGFAGVSGRVVNSGGRLYLESSFSYLFEPTPAPTPEPSTLLLLGSAVVGAFWRRARSGRQSLSRA